MTKAPGGPSLINRLLLRGDIRTLAVTSMITGAYVSMLNTILQPFVVKDLGFSVAILGVLVAVGARPVGIASTVVQPVAGYLADLFGRKSLIVAGSAVGVCSMVSFLLAAITHNLLPLSIGYILMGLSLLGYPASQAAIGESVSMDPAKLSIALNVVFFFTMLPGAIVPFAAGILVTSVGYGVLFAAAAIMESVNLVVLLAQFRETRGRSQLDRARHLSMRSSLTKVIQIPPGFIKLFTPFAMDALFYGLCGSIIYGMWADQFGLTPTDIGLVVGSFSVSVVLFQYGATRLLLRMGIRKTLAISEALTVIVLLGWLLTTSLPLLMLTGVVLGASAATWTPAQSRLILAAAPEDERGSISGKLAAFRGMIGFPAPIIGGLLFNAFGYYVPVFLGFVGEIATTIAVLELIPRN